MNSQETATRLHDLARKFRALQTTELCQHAKPERLDSVMWVRLEILAHEAEALSREFNRRALARPGYRDLTPPFKLAWSGSRQIIKREC